MRRLSFALALSLVFPAAVAAQDASTPGTVSAPHPTLEHLSIEWELTGDDDEDGIVTVRFREQGASAWRAGHPLVRVPAGSNEGFSWSNRHSGSVFGLTPGTTYEVELSLEDPDGGDATQTLTASTRPVPEVSASAPRIAVTPATIGDALRAAGPGDVLVLGAGSYASITVANDGAAGMPIVLQGAEGGGAIVDGEVRMDGRSHVWVRELTVNGQIKFNNSEGIVVEGCVIDTDRDGIVAFANGTIDGYFADNVVTGPTVWQPSALGASGDNLGEGIAVTGPGNVIAHNRVENFRDCVSLLEDSGANDQFSIDIIGNDLRRCADDAIEADFSMGNVRVIRNRSAQSFIAWSSQPSLGGPTWFIRNVAYANVFQVFKPNRSSLGDLLYHNTVVKQGDAFGVYTSDVWGRARSRNNLFLGGSNDDGMPGSFDPGPGRILQVSTLDTSTSSFDFDGFGSTTMRFDGRYGATRFDDFAGLTSMTSEANAVQVDMSVFASAPAFPGSVFGGGEPPDLRLADGSAAVDVGEPIPNVNDGFAGGAPDLGAYELGSALPPYGPRNGAPVCGNGVVEAGESCDDGNIDPGDGCSPSCDLEMFPSDDGGVTSPDGGTGADGGAGVDGGTGGGEDDGCGCRATGRSGRGAPWALLGIGLVLSRLRQRRRARAPRGSR